MLASTRPNMQKITILRLSLGLGLNLQKWTMHYLLPGLKHNYLNVAVSCRVIQCDQNIHFFTIDYLRDKLVKRGFNYTQIKTLGRVDAGTRRHYNPIPLEERLIER